MSHLARDTPNITWVVSRLARSDTVRSVFIGSKVHTRAVLVVVITNGLRAAPSREAISLECLHHTGRRQLHCMHIHPDIHIFNKVAATYKLWMPKIRKKSPIHENADANITCDFGDGDISRSRSRFTHVHGQADSRIASSIMVRFWVWV